MEENLRSFVFTKNCVGSLIIVLESYDGAVNAKRYELNQTINRLTIPGRYALGLFVTQSALSQLKQGFFKVEDELELRKLGASFGLCASPEEEQKVVKNVLTLDEIKEVILTNKKANIEPLLKKVSAREKDYIMTVATDPENHLWSSTVALINSYCGPQAEVEKVIN